MWGKITDGLLQISGDVLYTETEQIFNAKPELWLANGWKSVYWDAVEDVEKEYKEVFEETNECILVHFENL